MNPLLVLYIYGFLQLVGTARTIVSIGNGDEDERVQRITAVVVTLVTVLYFWAVLSLPH